MTKQTTKQRKWKRGLAAGLGGLVLLGTVGAGVIYWQYFRKDPQFLEEKQQSDQVQQEIDDLFGDPAPGATAGAER